MAISPSAKNAGLVTLDILVEGKSIPDQIQVVSIFTMSKINKITSAEIVILTSENEIGKTINNTFLIGSEIDIKAGYDTQNKSIFKGRVVRQKIEGNQTGKLSTVIKCEDVALSYKINRVAELELTLGVDVLNFALDVEKKRNISIAPRKKKIAQTSTKSESKIEDQLTRVKGDVSFQGSSLAEVNSLIELGGFGVTYDGDAFINKVKHTIENGNWKTQTGLGLHEEWLVTEGPELETPEPETPEPEIILDKSIFYDFDGFKISVDENDKGLNIETPKANQLSFSDKDKSIVIKDQNGNQLIMDSNGIHIKSASNLVLEAAKEIELKAGTKIDMKAKSNVDLEAVAIKVKGQASLSMEGAGSTELKSSGITTIKGAIVKIN